VTTLVALAVVALAGSAVFAIWKRTRPATMGGIGKTIRVQVLNGSGEAGIGTRVASYLREGGFQVVDVRNADRSDYFASLVVARSSDLSPAREVSHYLGGPPLIRQAWASELADVTVLIGSDRSRLRMEP
jgi:hypothetical protein